MQIDNTKRSTYQTCPRKFYLRHILNITSENGSTALRYGSTWHALMEGYYSSIAKYGWDTTESDHIQCAIDLATATWEKETSKKSFYDDYRTLENCFTSFIEYLTTFQDDRSTLRILKSERLFKIKMELTDSEKLLFPYLADIDLFFTGKLDLETEMSGHEWINEFKTTGQPAQTQAARLNRSAQILGYTWAAKHLGSDITGVLTVLHQLTARKNKDGLYGKPTRAFLRHPNVFSTADLACWRESFLHTCNHIAASTDKENFPCQFDSCYQFGQCQYTRLCEQNRPAAELNLTGFITEEWDVLKTGGSSDTATILEA